MASKVELRPQVATSDSSNPHNAAGTELREKEFDPPDIMLPKGAAPQTHINAEFRRIVAENFGEELPAPQVGSKPVFVEFIPTPPDIAVQAEGPANSTSLKSSVEITKENVGILQSNKWLENKTIEVARRDYHGDSAVGDFNYPDEALAFIAGAVVPTPEMKLFVNSVFPLIQASMN